MADAEQEQRGEGNLADAGDEGDGPDVARRALEATASAPPKTAGMTAPRKADAPPAGSAGGAG